MHLKNIAIVYEIMIYLIITTSIHNRFGIINDNERKERYLYAISETLHILPKEITPIIVENNGERETYLDRFPTFYTDNNKYMYQSKGINEMLDIKDIIKHYGMNNNDIIIKVTGRYRVLSPTFFNYIIEHQHNYDAFVKFYNVSSLMYEEYDCFLGCYAIRVMFLMLFNHASIANYKSAEIAFAKYIKRCGARVKEIENMDIECSFSDDLRKLHV